MSDIYIVNVLKEEPVLKLFDSGIDTKTGQP